MQDLVKPGATMTDGPSWPAALTPLANVSTVYCSGFKPNKDREAWSFFVPAAEANHFLNTLSTSAEGKHVVDGQFTVTASCIKFQNSSKYAGEGGGGGDLRRERTGKRSDVDASLTKSLEFFSDLSLILMF